MIHNYLYYGPPGSGKTYEAKKKVIEIIKEYEITNLNKQFKESIITSGNLNYSDVNRDFNNIKEAFSPMICFVSLHEGYSYSNFVEGIEVSTNLGMTRFKNKDKLFLNLLENINNYNSPGFLILDDIDRVNIGLVMGETLNALEYRESEVTLMSGKKIVIPKNLYIIVTLGTLQIKNKPDYAFLRRFKITRLEANNGKLMSALNEYKNRRSGNPIDLEEFNSQTKFILGSKSGNSDGLYNFYNSIAKNVTYEFENNKQEYELGYSYFLPPDDCIFDDIVVACQHKIRHQVIPLLQEYSKEGIINSKNVPTIARTNTIYTRERSSVIEPRIKIKEDCDTSEYGDDIFRKGIIYPNNTAYSKTLGRGSLKVNKNYLMIYEIVRDIIKNNLINDFELMDLFLLDRQIICTRSDLVLGGGGLFAEDEIADKIIMRRGGPDRNNFSLYNNSFHKLIYRNNIYRMVSKLSGNNSCPKDIKNCFASDTGQNSNPLKALKVLVYNYLYKFKVNLKNYIKNCTSSDKLTALKELDQLNSDIYIVSRLTTKSTYIKEPYYVDEKDLYINIVNKIRRLTTWDNMINKKLKGVYKNMDFEYKKIMDTTGVHQMILQGPPGTSKTYGVKEFLSIQAGLIKEKGEKWEKTDIETHKLELVENQYKIKSNLAGLENTFWDIIQFHPSYCYEDFVRGITVSTKSAGSKIIGKMYNAATSYDMELDSIANIEYKTINKTFGRMCEFAQKNPDYDFYLVIDEINRANLSTVFGELIYALEYRGEEVTTPYMLDISGGNNLKVPNNLYIIGTMNTADKSVGNIDYAIRRRFLFFPTLPSPIPIVQSIPEEEQEDSDELRLFYCIEELFKSCLNNDDYIKEDVQIGHTYFIRDENSKNSKEEMRYRFLFQVVPVIREYLKDGVIIKEKNTSNMIKNIFDLLGTSSNHEMEDKYKTLIASIEDGYKDYIPKYSYS